MRAHQPKFEVLPEPTWCRCGAELLGTGGRGGGLAATIAAAAAVQVRRSGSRELWGTQSLSSENGTVVYPH
eukprot:6391222-Prymnesium_polylepis.1